MSQKVSQNGGKMRTSTKLLLLLEGWLEGWLLGCSMSPFKYPEETMPAVFLCLFSRVSRSLWIHTNAEKMNIQAAAVGRGISYALSLRK